MSNVLKVKISGQRIKYEIMKVSFNDNDLMKAKRWKWDNKGSLYCTGNRLDILRDYETFDCIDAGVALHASLLQLGSALAAGAALIDEELAAVGAGAGVGHSQRAAQIHQLLIELVLKLTAPAALATGAITVSNVTVNSVTIVLVTSYDSFSTPVVTLGDTELTYDSAAVMATKESTGTNNSSNYEVFRYTITITLDAAATGDLVIKNTSGYAMYLESIAIGGTSSAPVDPNPETPVDPNPDTPVSGDALTSDKVFVSVPVEESGAYPSYSNYNGNYTFNGFNIVNNFIYFFWWIKAFIKTITISLHVIPCNLILFYFCHNYLFKILFFLIIHTYL